MSDRNLTINPQDQLPVNCAGADFIYIKKAPYELTIQTEKGEKFTIPEGGSRTLNQPVDNYIYVSHNGVLATSFTLFIGNGSYTEPQIAGTVNISPKTNLIGLARLTLTGVNTATILGKEGRKELHINSDSANTGLIYPGTNAAGFGIPLEPGQTAVFEISGDLEIYASASDQVINLSEVV